MTLSHYHRLRVSLFFLSLPLDDVFNSSCPLEGQNAESAMLVTSLREVIRKQAQEIEGLRNEMKDLSTIDNEVRKKKTCIFIRFILL